MTEFFFRMKVGVYPYEQGEVVRTFNVEELRHYVNNGFADAVEKSVYEAAADVEAAPKAELPVQEEEAGEGSEGAGALPKAPRGRPKKTKE